MRISILFMLFAVVGCGVVQTANSKKYQIQKINEELKKTEIVRGIATILGLPLTLPLCGIEVFAEMINDEGFEEYLDDKERHLKDDLKKKSVWDKKELECKLKKVAKKREALKARQQWMTKWVNAKLCNVVEAGIAKLSEGCCRGNKYVPTYELEKRLTKLKK